MHISSTFLQDYAKYIGVSHEYSYGIFVTDTLTKLIHPD